MTLVNNIESVIKLFADDTSLSLALNNPDWRAEIMNRDLEKNIWTDLFTFWRCGQDQKGLASATHRLNRSLYILKVWAGPKGRGQCCPQIDPISLHSKRCGAGPKGRGQCCPQTEPIDSRSDASAWPWCPSASPWASCCRNSFPQYSTVPVCKSTPCPTAGSSHSSCCPKGHLHGHVLPTVRHCRSCFFCLLSVTSGRMSRRKSAVRSDQVSVTSVSDQVSVTSVSDQVSVTSGSNQVSVTSGSDQVSVTSGSNQVSVTSGFDQVSVSSGSDQVSVTSGFDQVSVSSGSDQVFVTSAFDQVSVTSGSNQVSVTSGFDQVSVTSGSDQVSDTSRCQSGNQHIQVWSGVCHFRSDQVFVTSGSDQVSVTSGSDQVSVISGCQSGHHNTVTYSMSCCLRCSYYIMPVSGTFKPM